METKTIRIKEEIEISLKGKGTAGYTWKYSVAPEDIIAIEQKKAVKKVSSPPLPGASFDETFTLRGIHSGTAIVHFSLSRSWESNAKSPVDEREIKIVVE